jgi:hypothetical protein
MKPWTFIVVCTLFVAGCERSYSPARADEHVSQPKEIGITVDEGWVDLTFSVTSVTKAADGYHIRVQSTHQNHPIGFNLILKNGLPKGFIRGQEMKPDLTAFVPDGIALVRSGVESDYFVHFLAEQYKQKPPASMRSKVILGTFVLSGNPANLENERVEIKVFGESESEDDAYEAYINLELSRNIVELREKDADYRKALIKGFGT